MFGMITHNILFKKNVAYYLNAHKHLKLCNVSISVR